MKSSVKSEALGPVERSRVELGDAILKALVAGALSDRQYSELGFQLQVPGIPSSYVQPRRRQDALWDINDLINAREKELETRRFVRRQLAQTGMLALAVGDREVPLRSIARSRLMTTSQVNRVAINHPNVSKQVILDKLLERDVAWLSEVTVPLET